MRWVLLLLSVLNVFLYVWHRQKEPMLYAKLTPVGAYRSGPDAITLLAEFASGQAPKPEGRAMGECLYLGEFSVQAAAEVVLQRLRSLGGEGGVVSDDVTAGIDYWVYLPPFSSRQASIRQLKELQSRGVDAYVIAVGELENGISLGIHADEPSANALVSKVQSLGYRAEVRELPRPYRVYRLGVSRLPLGHTSYTLARALGFEDSVIPPKIGTCQK